MARYLLVVPTSPVDGRDSEYNDWYENIHLDEVLAVPGYVAAQRFEMVGDEAFVGPTPAHRYLALYEMEAENLDAALKALKDSALTMNISEAINIQTAGGVVFRPIGERHVAKKA